MTKAELLAENKQLKQSISWINFLARTSCERAGHEELDSLIEYVVEPIKTETEKYITKYGEEGWRI